VSKDNYISTTEMNLDKIMDYVFHDIPKCEENMMETYFDNHEELAAEVDSLLDFCLEQNMNKFMVRHFMKNRTSEALNEILENIDFCLNEIAIQTKMPFEVIEQPIIETTTVITKTDKATKIGKQFLKVAFTLLLVLNLPFWQSYSGDASSSSLLKASQKEKVQQMMTLSAYEIQNMRVDMLDDRPITDFMTIVAIPSSFELRYITVD
jgi:GTP-binding protein EngB required for normal cell division